MTQESVGTHHGQKGSQEVWVWGCLLHSHNWREYTEGKKKEPTFENSVYGKRLVTMQGALSSLQAEAQPCRGLLQCHCADSGLL